MNHQKKRRRKGEELGTNCSREMQRRYEGRSKRTRPATEMWLKEKEKEKFKRKTAVSIVKTINAVHGTNINERTVRRYVHQGNIGVPIVGRGKKCVLPESIAEALQSAVATNIQLSNAGMKKMPDR